MGAEFHRPVTQENAGDALLGTSRFGVFPNPWAAAVTVPISDPSTGGPPSSSSPSTKTYAPSTSPARPFP